MKSKDIIKELQNNGWSRVRINGSHHIFKKPGNPNTVPVPHPKDLPIGTVKSIKKRAGI